MIPCHWRKSIWDVLITPSKWHNAIGLGNYLCHWHHCCQGDLAAGQSMLGSYWPVWIASDCQRVCCNVALAWHSKQVQTCSVDMVEGRHCLARYCTVNWKTITRDMFSHKLGEKNAPLLHSILLNNSMLAYKWYSEFGILNFQNNLHLKHIFSTTRCLH